MTDTLSSSIHDGQAIINKRTSGGVGNYGWAVGMNTSERRIQVAISGGVSHLLKSHTQIELNCWNHIVVEYINSSNTVKVYINGILDSNTATLSTPNPSNNASIKIGNDSANNNSHNYDFHGMIDDIRIYNRALNSCTIDSLYNQCQFIDCSNIDEDDEDEDETGTGTDSCNSFNIFPIPNNGNFRVEVSNVIFENSPNITLVLRNTLGVQVKEIKLIENITDISLDLVDIASGVYFATISTEKGCCITEKGNCTMKIVIQR